MILLRQTILAWAGMGELLNNHMYSACIAQDDAYCDISLTANNLVMTDSSGMCSDAVILTWVNGADLHSELAAH